MVAGGDRGAAGGGRGYPRHREEGTWRQTGGRAPALGSAGRERADSQGRTYRAQTPLFGGDDHDRDDDHDDGDGDGNDDDERRERYKSRRAPHSRCISLVRAYLPHWRTARSTFSARPSYFPPSFYPAFLRSSLLSFPPCENALVPLGATSIFSRGI